MKVKGLRRWVDGVCVSLVAKKKNFFLFPVFLFQLREEREMSGGEMMRSEEEPSSQLPFSLFFFVSSEVPRIHPK